MTIKAHEIEGLGAQLSDDGLFALIQFKRKRPMTNGEDSLWMAVPRNHMPYLATLCFRMLPQAKDGMNKDIPAAFDAQVVEFGATASGQMVLTMELERGAAISYEIDRGQAEALLSALQSCLGQVDLGPPPGTQAN
jgi:hypothetical protein